MLAALRRLAAPLLPAVLAGSLIAGCGGDDTESVTEVLDRAFNSSIESADVSLDVQVELDGVEQVEGPLELTLTGPYQSGGGERVPSVDWDIGVRAQNQSFNAGVTSTGDRAFLAFQGTDYELDQRSVRQLNRRIAASAGDEDRQSLGDFGVTARDWVVDASDSGDQEVAGVDTHHVSGRLDVSRALEDLNKVVEEAAKLSGQGGPQPPPRLTDEQKRQIEEVIENPRFDAYVGKEDDILRRLSADLEFQVPEDSREQVGGLEGGRISFSIEFADVGTPKEIEAPADPRPVSELTQQLQGLLGGALGAAPPPGEAEGSAGPQDGADAGAQTDAEKQKAYEDCVRTAPDDPQVEAFCQVLLQ